jgi:GNAT superfamily N-acetyltransferase
MSEQSSPQAKSWDDGTHKIQYFPWFTPAHPHFYVLSDSKSGQLMSNMTLGRDGEVMGLETHPKHQNKGLATKIWNTAHKNADNAGTKPKHSDLMTEAGEGWAKKVGGEMPARVARSRDTSMFGMIDFKRQ